MNTMNSHWDISKLYETKSDKKRSREKFVGEFARFSIMFAQNMRTFFGIFHFVSMMKYSNGWDFNGYRFPQKLIWIRSKILARGTCTQSIFKMNKKNALEY